MKLRYTPVVATAALFLSLTALAVAIYRPELGSIQAQVAVRQEGELFCLNGFAYQILATSPDSGYGGAEILTVMTELKGEPSYDKDGNEYPRLRGPRACSKS
ncbi:hypothetical protein [Pseudomonas chlororaphis]|uniref:hypothetical protein n=1 Tax=Pseudomonas chlororaphis TaxID=587753 RepID=UPI002D7795AF|nr:hypothetical protein [Pseudomonas chlororaphis]